MDFERALETQRLALLRLLAGLAVAVWFVSCLPVVSMVPRQVRSVVASILIRAESAAASLVYVAALVLARRDGIAIANVPMPNPALSGGDLSAKVLLRRIAALRAVLDDLPRHAKRLIQRYLREREDQRLDRTHPLTASKDNPSVLANMAPLGRMDRPPDKRWRAAA